MEILSLQFGVFAIFSAIIFHLLPWKFKQSWLLVISYIFYCLVDVRYALVLFAIASANFFLAQRSKKSPSHKIYLYAALLLNLVSFSLLKWLTSKYVGVFLNIPEFQGAWLLPAGFSFYLLQLISFQIAINKNSFNEFPKFSEFLLLFVYFPKLLSGPIEKPVVFLQKIKQPLLVDNAILGKALGLIFNGLLRKVIIANILNVLIPPTFKMDGSASWLSIISYGIILYNDFAGYTCIVRGLSLFLELTFQSIFNNRILRETSRNFGVDGILASQDGYAKTSFSQ